MIVATLLALSSTFIGSSTLVMIDSAAPVPQAVPAKPDAERLVCRTQERLGTRLGAKRVYNTKARWAEIEAESGAAVREAQRTMASSPSSGR